MEQEQIKERRTRIRSNEKMIAGVKYMTSCRAAEELGVSRNCIAFYARSGELKSLLLGGIRYFRDEWIKQFVEGMTT